MKSKFISFGKIFLLVILFIFAFFTRFWQLGEIPSAINGDEIGSLVHPWQILFGQLSVFSLTHDGSVPALVYYSKALLLILVGLEKSLFAARAVTAVYSLLSMALFYWIAKKRFSFFFFSFSNFFICLFILVFKFFSAFVD